MRPEALEIISLLKLCTNEEGSNYIERATDQGVDEVIERYKKLRSKGLNAFFIFADYFTEIFYHSCYVKDVRYRENINLSV